MRSTRLVLLVLAVLAALVAAAIAQTTVEVNPTISCGGCCPTGAGSTTPTGCPCKNEIKEACGGKNTNGPDFDNDPNWRFIGMANFMNEARIKELPNREELTPAGVDLEYSIERERPVAVSPEGRMYLWQGAITEFGDALEGPDFSHFGVDRPSTRPVPGELPPGPCVLLNELPLGRSTVSGNGALLGELPGARINGAPFTEVTGGQTPFPVGGLEVAEGPVLRVNAAITISFTSPRVRAVLIQGLRALDRTVNLGVNSGAYLYAGTSWPNVTAPTAASGIELRYATVGDPTGLLVLSDSPIHDLLIGHFAFSRICTFEDVDDFLGLPFLYTPSATRGRSVIGTDTRIRHFPTTGYPLRTMGAIHSPNGDVHYCSGAKVGPRHFLTAGHCMFDKDTKMWIPNAKIWFGQNGDGGGLPPPASQAPFGIKHHVWYYTTKGWVEDQDWKYDYGMIVLQDTAATANLGWLGYSSDWTKSQAGNTVNLRGHPGSGQTCAASPLANDKCGGFLYGDAGSIWFQFPYHLYYKIDTSKGNSGSAVYFYNGDDRWVVGVHAYGSNGDALNKAVRIRGAVFDNIKSWKKQWPSAFA